MSNGNFFNVEIEHKKEIDKIDDEDENVGFFKKKKRFSTNHANLEENIIKKTMIILGILSLIGVLYYVIAWFTQK